MIKKRFISGLLLLITLSIPFVAHWLESNMTGQMLVQMPALIVSGYWIGKGVSPVLPKWWKDYNRGGVGGVLLASFVVTFWMLPRSVDASLAGGLMEIFKYISLPLLAGVPLALSWPFLHPIGRHFVLANLISMLFVMGWLFLVSPVRLCNNYLIDQQTFFGRALLVLTGLLTLLWGLQGFLPRAGIFREQTKEINT